MTNTNHRTGFWRDLMQGFRALQRLQWQAPWREQKIR